jgi:hypothetical protein
MNNPIGGDKYVWRQQLCINRCIVHSVDYRTDQFLFLINQTV